MASAMVNTTQQIDGSIGTAVFSSLAASAVTSYPSGHAGTAPSGQLLAEATIASYHLVFWISAAVFAASAALTALMFRSGPLTTAVDAPLLAAH
ncbi:hypothetical protein ACIA8I_20005 [Streptomyces rishiriensis]|uniref:hypothetical protein n=1 Tax=Streptomyces rishiriensis TaxID=68264 RepID=UPI0037A30F00